MCRPRSRRFGLTEAVYSRRRQKNSTRPSLLRIARLWQLNRRRRLGWRLRIGLRFRFVVVAAAEKVTNARQAKPAFDFGRHVGFEVHGQALVSQPQLGIRPAKPLDRRELIVLGQPTIG